MATAKRIQKLKAEGNPDYRYNPAMMAPHKGHMVKITTYTKPYRKADEEETSC